MKDTERASWAAVKSPEQQQEAEREALGAGRKEVMPERGCCFLGASSSVSGAWAGPRVARGARKIEAMLTCLWQEVL